jgi:hypothetical protein
MPTADNTNDANDTNTVRVWCATTNKTYSGKTLEEARAARDAARVAFVAPTPNPSGENNANRKRDYVPRPGRAPGPHTSSRRIIQLPENTPPGGVLACTIAALEDQLGGNVTAAESLLIQAAAIKVTRLYLLGKKLLDDGELKTDDHALAYMNSMRCDLTALGLGQRVKDVTPNLKDIIKQHENQGAQEPCIEEPSTEEACIEDPSTEDADTPGVSNVQDAAE